MESLVFETLARPQTEIRYGDILEQLSNLSVDDISNSKYVTSKCQNRVSERNLEKKSNSEKFILNEDKEMEKNLSLFKNKEFSKFVVEPDVESVFCKHSNENCKINSKKKNYTKNSSFEENYENVENQFSSLSLNNNKVLNKSYEGGSAGDESDSDNDEKVPTIRERDPTRHNRADNNKQSRATPFPLNQRRASRPHTDSNNTQTFGHFTPNIFNGFACNDGYTLNHINSTNFERFGFASSPSRSFHSDFQASELMSNEAPESLFSNTIAPVDNFSSVAENQIVDGVNPYPVTDETFDSLVPTVVEDIRNVSDEFSVEINDFSYLDNLDRNSFESNSTGCAVINIDEETPLDSYFEDLTTEEAMNIYQHLTDSKEIEYLYHNNTHLNSIVESPMHILPGTEVENKLNNSFTLNQNNIFGSSFEKINYPMNNGPSLCPEPGHIHSEANIRETSLYSEEVSFTSNQNNIFGSSFEKINHQMNNGLSLYPEPGHIHSEANIGETSVYTEEVSFTSNQNNIFRSSFEDIYNGQSLYPEPGQIHSEANIGETSVYSEEVSFTSNQNNIFRSSFEDIYNGQSLCPEPGQIHSEANIEETCLDSEERHRFPFFGLDDDSLSKFFTDTDRIQNTSEDESSDDSKSTCKTEKIKICWKLGTEARDRLFHSPSFSVSNYNREMEKIRLQIQSGKLGTKEKKVIHMLPKHRKTKYRGSNLHKAIRSKNVEEVCCLVECHKEYHDHIKEINLVDNDGNRTVLDYSIEYGMDLLTDYLVENLAKRWTRV